MYKYDDQKKLCIDIDFHKGLHTIVRVFFPKHGVSHHF